MNGSHQSLRRVDVDVAAGVEDEKVQGVPRGEQHCCAHGQQRGQRGGPRCGPRRGGQLGGRARAQMAGPLHVGLCGQQNVLEGDLLLCGLSDPPGGLRGQLGELRELLDELGEHVGVLLGGHCDEPDVELGGFQLVGHVLDGGHRGDVRQQGEGQGRVR